MTIKDGQFICGDALAELRKLPTTSIDMCLTSPPYWGLRDYGIGPDQLGLEPNPELYIEHMTEIFNEIKRVLKKEGTLWLNIGDTYWSAKGSCFNPGGGKDSIETKRREIYPLNRGNKSDVPNLSQKCLTMVPERLAWSLIQDGWILRNKIIWYKPNAMPSSVKDRFSNRWEYLFMFSKSQHYYFDLDAVREPHKYDGRHDTMYKGGPKDMQIGKHERWPNPAGKNPGDVEGLTKHDIAVGRIGNFSYTDPLHTKENYPKGKNPGDIIAERKWKDVPGQVTQAIGRDHKGWFKEDGTPIVDFEKGKNPGDFWDINTQPFPEAHFAVFPENLCRKPIKAGCPEFVCRECGKARKRITKTDYIKNRPSAGNDKRSRNEDRLSEARGHGGWRGNNLLADVKTIGWTDCKCKAGFEPGVVLDPFAGAGTVGVVAKSLGRRFILIDIKEEYMKMAKRRVAQVGHQKELFK